MCGKKQKLLKRHLSSAHNLTPPEYREMFGLRRDYPMTAPSYVEMRAEIARRVGLGRPKKPAAPRQGGQRPSVPAPDVAVGSTAALSRRRGRSAAQIRSGVAGMSIWRTSCSASASRTA